MKYLIVGYNCAGKSFFSEKLSSSLNISVLHIDDIYYDYSTVPKTERHFDDVKKDLFSFIDTNDSWVLDGGYDKTGLYESCLAADRIIFMRINRFSRLLNLARRCKAKYHFFNAMPRFFQSLPWLLHYGCGKKYDADNYSSIHRFPNKVIVLKTISQAQKYFDKLMNANEK